MQALHVTLGAWEILPSLLMSCDANCASIATAADDHAESVTQQMHTPNSASAYYYGNFEYDKARTAETHISTAATDAAAPQPGTTSNYHDDDHDYRRNHHHNPKP